MGSTDNGDGLIEIADVATLFETTNSKAGHSSVETPDGSPLAGPVMRPGTGQADLFRSLRG